jgi:hypothetical protein
MHAGFFSPARSSELGCRRRRLLLLRDGNFFCNSVISMRKMTLRICYGKKIYWRKR